MLNEEIRTLRKQVEQAELLAGEIQASHRQPLSWAGMFDAASIEEKKMIASYLIKAVTLSRDYGIQVGFNVSEAQYLGGMDVG